MAAHPRHKVPGAKKGRPSNYNPAYCTVVKKMVRLGATTIEVAAALDMPVHRVYAWRAAYQEFSDSFKIAMTTATDRVERSLFEKATGYTYPSERIFCNKNGTVTRVPIVEHVPPETAAAIFWLKNRRPEVWADTKTFAGDPNNPVTLALAEAQGSVLAFTRRIDEIAAAQTANGAAGGLPGPAPLPRVGEK
jgi:hypothetical protein